jgi:hypothetical protein
MSLQAQQAEVIEDYGHYHLACDDEPRHRTGTQFRGCEDDGGYVERAENSAKRGPYHSPGLSPKHPATS